MILIVMLMMMIMIRMMIVKMESSLDMIRCVFVCR